MILTQHTLAEEAKHAVRILLAEDNPMNQRLAQVMLTNRCKIPIVPSYPPVNRGNASLILLMTNWTAIAMSNIPMRRFMARYSRCPIFLMIYSEFRIT